ncbi:MAG: hypothetical protein A2418_02630 [Candidatus Brennerbacteria bacterium RIFOXYC1_FULL_41_11]|uniref:DUF1648 domain-containing protein n=1 Tax=Candidatus Brennerbacteria bacterium RIFOXYD1_FULL_41_16 TaxID=1797529 RepID=A0A1G1XJM4_9BACT|nr:MAG: hypothetical protein UU61_C0033G0004 [Parcubacteria group bacterium GW2011_GWB1_41_4]OGY38793.1 MAG: hypothetical protein A2391_02385 [Candidatus Brennerbacteria bacterium RIFOXYB1_FULL_41_13]OGY39076.1 MAG: hypothetical protein A2418_02630 [Candidatus Brennerbacteria bacterium RIFOXYC1_FULL_41_11]OGY40229.1 MAG: hypothetical protein A2570_03010 [Candidatus Brennerbacteria bacterium RIFOXYD1_FULL_41_16]
MKYLIVLAFLMNFVSWGMIFYFVPEVNFPFIVKYNISAGKDIFGTKLSLFSLPAMGLLILVINAILALSLIKINKELSTLILGMTCFFEILIGLYAWITIFINTY